MKQVKAVAALLLPLAVQAQSPAPSTASANVTSLDTVIVTTPRRTNTLLGASSVDGAAMAPQRAISSDSAQLLQDIPGVSLYSAGGVSGLPAIHGLADDRIRIQVDGMDLAAACPNHMNPALSYIDPVRVASAVVFAGITPVSVGGDSIGGTIQVQSAAPDFADPGATLTKGQWGGFWRSNGQGYGGNVLATIASETLSLTYSGSSTQSGNYLAATAFKPAGPGTPGGPWLDGNEIGSTRFDSRNQDIGLAVLSGKHLLQFNLGHQRIGFEGFPNQRMDMTGNTGTQANLRYSGMFDWGELLARYYDQSTEHAMNMGSDRFSYGTLGMPMLTEANATGSLLQTNIPVSKRDTLRLGLEAQTYTLYDWWPPAGGVMGPNTFWNIDYGRRNRLGAFSEWEARWDSAWLTQIGIRHDTVSMDASAVQGYNAQAIWAVDAATFNAREHLRTDHNWDMTVLARHTPDMSPSVAFEFGLARKSHSPNLYQRYAWSTQPMATLMNNFAGDGNGYVGNPDLLPEVAHTLSLGGDWHDDRQKQWQVKATGYVTQVENYIDAQRCNTGQCGGTANLDKSAGFVNLQYVNQQARLHGLDLSARTVITDDTAYGIFTARAVLNLVRGSNTTTGDKLYNIMPDNLKLALEHHLNAWNHTVEVQLVSAKTQVSQVRNEMQAAGYGLLNLHSSYSHQPFRLDIGVENVLNQFYSLPLGGAYLGQGASMSSNSIPWGTLVPGRGRSIHMAFNVSF